MVKPSKEKEFREYLVSAGAAELIVKLFVVAENLPIMLEDDAVLKRFFGETRDPVWDEIELLRDSSSQLRESNAMLEENVLVLSSNLQKLELDNSVKKWWANVSPKKKEELPKKDVVLKMVGLTDIKKANTKLMNLLPNKFTVSSMLEFVRAEPDMAKFIRWDVWNNSDPSDDEIKFWESYTEHTK